MKNVKIRVFANRLDAILFDRQDGVEVFFTSGGHEISIKNPQLSDYPGGYEYYEGEYVEPVQHW